MTKAGIGFIIGGVVVYIMGGQTQVGWLYLFDAMIWSVVLLSAVLPWWSLRSLRVERQVRLSRIATWPDDLVTPVEDGTVEVGIKVSNQGRLARYLIKVIEDCPLDGPAERPRAFLLFSVKPKSTVALTYSATCYRRGRYTSARAVLETSAPLGLFVRRRRYDLPFNVTVYPAQFRMEGVPAAREVWADQGHRMKSSAASEFYGSREYHHTDPLRHIHWRNTARRAQFVVKEFEETSQGAVLVAFENRRDWGEGKETTFEYSIRIAASLARHCGDSSHGIGILTPPSPLPMAHWLDAMNYLTGLTVGDTTSLDELTDSTQAGQTLVAIVPTAAPDLIPCLSRLASRDVRLVVVLLEGFVGHEASEEFASRLSGTGAGLVHCYRGNLKAAVDALGHSLYFAGQPAAAAD